MAPECVRPAYVLSDSPYWTCFAPGDSIQSPGRSSRPDVHHAPRCELGMRYMTRARYDPNALKGVFQTLALVSGGGGHVPEWQASHPEPENREAKITELMAATGEDYSRYRVDGDSFLRKLDGLAYGSNPKDGYFSGVLFKHPDLAFRIDFPVGWRTVNQSTQVVGVSPRDDALLALTPVPIEPCHGGFAARAGPFDETGSAAAAPLTSDRCRCTNGKSDAILQLLHLLIPLAGGARIETIPNEGDPRSERVDSSLGRLRHGNGVAGLC